MATVKPKFITKGESKKTGKSLIYLQAYHKRKRFIYSTNESILPELWDDKNQCADTSSKIKKEDRDNNEAINHRLQEFKSKFNSIINNFKYENCLVDFAVVKTEMDKEFRAILLDTVETDFYVFIEKFIKKSEAHKSEGTIKNYNNTKNYIYSFDEVRNQRTTFENINLDWYDDFTGYLKEPRIIMYKRGNSVKEVNMPPQSLNTIGRNIKNIKAFLNAAKERGIKINSEVSSKRFKVDSFETDKIYLTIDELDKIRELELNDNGRLEAVRDMFIVAAYTALRFSDFTQLKPANIHESKFGKFIKLRMAKTGNTVSIPLHPYAEKILLKYNFKMPTISNQKFNDYIKEVGMLANINNDVVLRVSKGNNTYDSTFKKWQKLSSHVGRRSGATNMYKAGIPEHTIMKITGHTTVKAFEAYLCLDDEEHLEIMQKNQFFNPSEQMIAV